MLRAPGCAGELVTWLLGALSAAVAADSARGQSGVEVKKGRHRRFVEARELKRSVGPRATKCEECGAEPEDVHAEWCLAEEDRYEEILGNLPRTVVVEDDPLAAEG